MKYEVEAAEHLETQDMPDGPIHFTDPEDESRTICGTDSPRRTPTRDATSCPTCRLKLAQELHFGPAPVDVEDDRPPVAFPRVIAEAVFDLATNSMDFGSGFMDDQEVQHLLDFAIGLGLTDPMVAVPVKFVTRFTHPVQERNPDSQSKTCGLCNRPRDAGVHLPPYYRSTR